MKEITGFSGTPIFKPARPGELNKSVLNVSKARKILGWKPKTPLDEGILKTVDWFKNHSG